MLTYRIILASLTFFAGIWLVSYPAYSKVSETTKPDEVPGLLKALQTGKEEVRIHAAYKLGLLWPRQDVGGTVAALVRAMKDPSEQVRVHAAGALGDLKAEQAINVLIDALHDCSPEVVLFAAQSVGEIGSPATSAVPELLNLLKNESSDTRKVATIALAEIGMGVKQVVPVMIEDLALPDESSRYEAALALGYMGQDAQPAIPALKDQSWNVQQEACRTLRDIGTSEAKDALKEYPESCDSRANITIGVEQAITMLIEDLSLPKEFSRLSAILSLGLKGQTAQAAIPALKGLLKDQSLLVQQEACNTLHLIGTSEAYSAIKEYTGNCSSGFRK